MSISDRFRRNVNGHDPTAVVGRRIIAWLLDSLFTAILVLLVHRGNAAFTTEAGGLAINPEVIWTITIITVINHVALTMKTGFSLGKAVTGLRVVRRIDGGRPGLRSAVGRTLPWLIPIPFVPIIEAGLLLGSRGHRRIGDRIGGTVVVDRGWQGEPIEVPGLNFPKGGTIGDNGSSAPSEDS